MFLGRQDFDFFPKPNQISSQHYQILPKLSKFYPNFPKFSQILPKFFQIYLKKFARGCGRTPSSYATEHLVMSLVIF